MNQFKIAFIIILTILSNITIAQPENLVPNPSFEDTIKCPYFPHYPFNYVKDWIYDINTADYYNSCCSGSLPYLADVPNVPGGYQCPANGNAFMGFIAISNNQYPRQYREYFGAKLKSPLVPGKKYYASIKFNLANSKNCACDKIGIKFTSMEFDEGYNIYYEPPLMNNIAHVYSNSIISDTLHWIVVRGSFIADSAYKYIFIGNFFDDFNTNIYLLNNSSIFSAYYYVDDVCVSEDSLTCIIPDGFNVCDTMSVNSNIFSDFFIIIDDNILTINSYENIDNYLLRIINLEGKILLEKKLTAKVEKIDIQNIDKGFYVLIIFSKKFNEIKKFIKL